MNTLMPLLFCAPPTNEVLPLLSTVNARPGTVSANSRKLRVTWGRFSMVAGATTELISEVLTSVGRLLFTVTVATTSPAAGADCRSRVIVDATANVTFASPPPSAFTWYGPGGRPTILYEPSAVARVRRVSPVAVLRAVICELGSARPRRAASTPWDQPVRGTQARMSTRIHAGEPKPAPLKRDCLLTNTVPLVCLVKPAAGPQEAFLPR